MVLFSGGLDSILACKVLQEQGIEVRALKCITPFFSYDLADGARKEEYRDAVRAKYGIEVVVADITSEYLDMVRNPPHGYGRYMNPCIDCKILMVKKALSLLTRYDASFVATGEVLGQRPMSQRRDTLRIIERDSGAEGLLLRPLSARFLRETLPEKEGIVDRDLLPEITGRSRKEQMRLADRFGIHDYPAPAGGCVLADPILSRRFRKIFETWPDFGPEECLLAQTGRHFLLPGGGWLVVGRNRAENEKMAKLVASGDVVLKATDRPGPLCLLKKARDPADIRLAASFCARYAKNRTLPVIVAVHSPDGVHEEVTVRQIPDDTLVHSFMF